MQISYGDECSPERAAASRDFNEMQNSRLGWDIGIGLTISTPLGPVRLDFAVPYMN